MLTLLITCLLSLGLAPPAADAQPGVTPSTGVPENTLLAAPAEAETVAVLAITGYNNIISDIDFMGGLAQRPGVGQMLDQMTVLFTQGRGLVGLDRTQPWGLLLRTDGVEFMPVGCLPVRDLAEMKMLVEAFGVLVIDLGDGVFEFQLPGKPSVFVKSVDGWAFLTSDTDFLSNLPADPAGELKAVLGQYDLAASVSVQKVPETYRTMAVEQLRAGLEEGLAREEDEDEETYQLRRRWSEGQLNTLVKLIEEIEDFNFGWSMDAEQERIYLDSVYRVAPGGKLDKVIASKAANARTDYAGFYKPEDAVCFTFVEKCDPEMMREDIDNFKMSMLTARQQIADAIDKEKDDLPQDPAARAVIKDAANDFLDALEATIETGQLDGAGVLSIHPDAVTLIAGGHVSDPAKIESGVKKLVALAEQEPDFPGIQWNADSYAGINFHTAQAPVEEDDEEARQIFGPTIDITLGIGRDSVYLGLGRDNLAALKGAIDASRAQPDKAVPMSEMLISVRQILEFSAALMDEDEEQQRMIVQSITDMLRNEAQGRDHIRIVGESIEHGVRYRLEAEEGVLKAIGKAIDAAQRAAAVGEF